MTVTKFSLVAAVSMLAASLAADAQPTGKVYRIGYLSNSSATASTRFVEAFREGLRALGWVEGQNIVIDYRFADGRFDRLPALAAELVRLKMDVIVAGPTPPAVAAKNATGTIPIVMASGAALRRRDSCYPRRIERLAPVSLATAWATWRPPWPLIPYLPEASVKDYLTSVTSRAATS